MSYFCVPEHTERTHCDCMTSTSGTKCSRQAKYRFVYESHVYYTCGIKSHLTSDKKDKNAFFVQRKQTPKGKWTWLYTKNCETESQDPPPPPPEPSPNTTHMDETIRLQKNTIAIQKSAIESLQIQIRKLQLLAERKAQTPPVGELEKKIETSTRDALYTAIQNNNVKNLKFQLHPDKHPHELRWLFEDLFKVVNV